MDMGNITGFPYNFQECDFNAKDKHFIFGPASL